VKTFFTKDFKKAYAKRISHRRNLVARFEERYDLFVEDQRNPILEDHALSGKLEGFRAFSITGDTRAVYFIHDNIAYFVDIGTHNQVYGK